MRIEIADDRVMIWVEPKDHPDHDAVLEERKALAVLAKELVARLERGIPIG